MKHSILVKRTMHAHIVKKLSGLKGIFKFIYESIRVRSPTSVKLVAKSLHSSKAPNLMKNCIQSINKRNLLSRVSQNQISVKT